MPSTVLLPLASAIPSETSIHRTIGPDHGIEPKGNATFLGRRYTLAAWRALARDLAGRESLLDERRRTALIAAMRHLDLLLERPVRVILERRIRTVEVLGIICYVADLDRRTLRAGLRKPDGTLVLHPEFEVTILPALHGEFWLPYLLDALGFDWRTPERTAHALEVQQLLFDPSGDVLGGRARDVMEQRMVDALHRMLHADRRFRAMRLEVGRRLLGADLLSVAARARTPSHWNLLALSHVARVWQAFDHYVEVAREAPRLLPLVALLQARCANGRLGSPSEVLKHLRGAVGDALPDGSLGEAGWQWLIRYGPRGLRPWFLRCYGATIEHIGRPLDSFREAGWPAPPPPAFWHAWIEHNVEFGAEPAGLPGWCGLVPRVRKLLLQQADRRRMSPGLVAWVRDAEQVMQMMSHPDLPPPRLPRGLGWSRAVRMAGRRERELGLGGAWEKVVWKSAIGERRLSGLVAVPITDGRALRAEGALMRHCVGNYVRACLESQLRFFSLRDETERRVATVSLKRTGSGRWEVDDVRRFANRNASQREWLAAQALAIEYSAVAGGARDDQAADRTSARDDDRNAEEGEDHV